MADALPASLDLLRPFGNAIVPEVAAAFIEVAIDCGIGANQIELSEAA